MNTNLIEYMMYFKHQTREYIEELFKQKGIDFVPNICGRVIRGKKPEDFLTLTDDPNRKIVMLMGPDGLNTILGLSGYKILETIGYETDYIARKVSEGCKFKLIVFPEGTPKIATWDNTVEVVSEAYPDIANDLKSNLQVLKTTPFETIRQISGTPWNEIDKQGETHSEFMTLERFKKSNRTAYNCRAFLYFTVHLRELFSGDGYTYTPQGVRGLTEYIVLNSPINKLGEYMMTDFDVILP